MKVVIHSASYMGYALEVRAPANGPVTARIMSDGRTLRLAESFDHAEQAKGRTLKIVSDRRRALAPKSSFLGWGFEGGFFAGGVAGSWAGSAGIAALAVGAFRAFRELDRAGLPAEHRASFLSIGFLFSVVGIVCLISGYQHYSDKCEEEFFSRENWSSDAPEWKMVEIAEG